MFATGVAELEIAARAKNKVCQPDDPVKVLSGLDRVNIEDSPNLLFYDRRPFFGSFQLRKSCIYLVGTELTHAENYGIVEYSFHR
jgi:hypothetical protein